MNVFLSYSTKDYFFAELLQIKLEEAKINLWRDKGNLLAGTDWRNGIETGISECVAVVIALSENSTESSYVTYEWAYAIGNGKPVIPIKITNCQMHPRLESIQYLDFTIPNSLPWDLLIERIKEIEVVNTTSTTRESPKELKSSTGPTDYIAKAILNYLNQKGFQMASFDRLRLKIDSSLTDDQLNSVIKENNSIFRSAILKGNKKGIAKLIP